MNKVIFHAFAWLVNGLSECNTYDWGAEYKEKELKDKFDKFYKFLQEKENIEILDLNKLTIEQAKELGFQRWDEESDIWLFPLWFLPLIPIGTEVTSISGDKIIYNGKNLDNDIRFGCIAYGVQLKQ